MKMRNQEIYFREANVGVTDLIMVLINSQGANTYENSIQAIEWFYEEHPEYRDIFHIHSIDGMGVVITLIELLGNCCEHSDVSPAVKRRIIL